MNEREMLQKAVGRLIENNVYDQHGAPDSDFAEWVRAKRRSLDLDRSQAAALLKVDKEVLFLLEHSLLRPEEFTPELQEALRSGWG
jgi:ribosome-binding protein aMBF1 (putative translation factor)